MGLTPVAFDRSAGPAVGAVPVRSEEPTAGHRADDGTGLPPVLEYRPASKPKSRKRPAGAAAGGQKASAGSGWGKGGWAWIVGIFFLVRACINSGSHQSDGYKSQGVKPYPTPTPTYRPPVLGPVGNRPAWAAPGNSPVGGPSGGRKDTGGAPVWPPGSLPPPAPIVPWQPGPPDQVPPPGWWPRSNETPSFPSRQNPDSPDSVGGS